MAEKLPASFVFKSGIDERYVWNTLDISAESAKKLRKTISDGVENGKTYIRKERECKECLRTGGHGKASWEPTVGKVSVIVVCNGSPPNPKYSPQIRRKKRHDFRPKNDTWKHRKSLGILNEFDRKL